MQDARVLIWGGVDRTPLSLEKLRALHGYDAHETRRRSVPPKGEEIANGVLCDWRLSDDAFRQDEHFRAGDKALYEDSLASLNATPRDARCVFVEATHTYYVDGQRVPWSGTSFSHYCERHFDADAVLARTRPGWARKKGLLREDGSEMDPEEIKAVWARNGESQSRRGTLMHWHIECYLNGYDIGHPQSPEFQMFLDFETHFMDALGLTPWRVEMNLFHCGLRLAGQADLVCTDHTGALVILDWKRSKEIKDVGHKNERQKPPLDHLPNSNRHCYNLQLNTYRHILETEYGYRVSGMYLVALHPAQRPPVPHVYQVPRMTEEILAIVRQASIDKGVSQDNMPGGEAPFDLAGTRFEAVVEDAPPTDGECVKTDEGGV
jgi:hypothetical protein